MMLRKASVFFLAGLLLTGSVFSCTPAATTCVEVPPAFAGVMAMSSIKTEPGEVKLLTGFPDLPGEMMVYQRTGPVIDDDYARKLAAKLGFGDEWPLTGGERQVYTYTRGDDNLELSLDGRLTLRCPQDIENVPVLPDDEECTEIAAAWLKDNGFYPENERRTGISYGGMSVAASDTATGESGPEVYYSKGITFISSLNGYENPSGAARVLIGDGGKIIQADVNLAEYREYGRVRLLPPQEAFGLLEEYHARLTPVPDPHCFCTGSAQKVTVNLITLQYYEPYQTDFLLPVYLFEGTGVMPELFKGYVDAVAR